MGQIINFDQYKKSETNNSGKEKMPAKKIINFDQYKTEKENEKKDQLTEEKVQAYSDFLAIIENLKKMGNREEMNKTLVEIAKAALRKLPPSQAIEVIKNYEKIISRYFPDNLK